MLATETSPDVAALVEALRSVSPGKAITYAKLSKAVGRDVRASRHLITSALRIVARDHGAVFSSERGSGYVRLTTDQLPSLGHTARAKVRRTSRKASKLIRYAHAIANDVRPETQRKINAEISALGLIEHVSRDRAARPVEVHDDRPEPVAMMARRLFQANGE